MRRYKVHRSLKKQQLVVIDLLNKHAVIAPVANLKNVTFHIDPTGQLTARGSGQRNVHAWVEGELTEEHFEPTTTVDYNPWKDDTFIIRGTSTPVRSCDYARITANGAMSVLNPKF